MRPRALAIFELWRRLPSPTQLSLPNSYIQVYAAITELAVFALQRAAYLTQLQIVSQI